MAVPDRRACPLFFSLSRCSNFCPTVRRAAWLTGEEKETVAARLAIEEPAGAGDLWSALRDPRVLALGLANFAFSAAGYGVGLWLPQIVQAMGFSNTATGFVVALCFVAGIPAMILCGRSSSIRGERIWHVALPWLLAGASLAAASRYAIQFDHAHGARLWGELAVYAAFGAFFSLPSSFLRGTAAAGGIGLFNTIGSFGGFFGPSLFGVLKQGSGDYATGMAAAAFGLVLAALIVLDSRPRAGGKTTCIIRGPRVSGLKSLAVACLLYAIPTELSRKRSGTMTALNPLRNLCWRGGGCAHSMNS